MQSPPQTELKISIMKLKGHFNFRRFPLTFKFLTCIINLQYDVCTTDGIRGLPRGNANYISRPSGQFNFKKVELPFFDIIREFN